MDYYWILLIAGIVLALEWHVAFRDNAHRHLPGSPDAQARPATGSYTMRNLVHCLFIVLSAGAVIGAIMYGINGALQDKVQAGVIAGALALAVAGTVGILKSVDRMVGERTQNLAAAIGASPITAGSDYAATTAINGTQLQFNITSFRMGKNTGQRSINYTVTADSYVPNGAGLRLALYRYYMQLPMGLHPGVVSPEDWAPYKARCSSAEAIGLLTAIKDMTAGIAAPCGLKLEYLYLAGDSFKSRITFLVREDENDMDDALTINRLKAALEIHSKAAAAVTEAPIFRPRP